MFFFGLSIKKQRLANAQGRMLFQVALKNRIPNAKEATNPLVGGIHIAWVKS